MSAADEAPIPRICAPANASLVTKDGKRTELPVRELSKTSVFLSTPTLVARAGDEVTLELSSLDRDCKVSLGATVTKAVMAPPEDGGGMLGLLVHFEEPSENQQQGLNELFLRLLEGTGGQRRAYPRISHRMEVSYGGDQGTRAVLRDISLGGASIWTEHPMFLGERVSLRVKPFRGPPLDLSAMVATIRMAQPGEPYHQSGLCFVDMSDALREGLRAFLVELMQG